MYTFTYYKNNDLNTPLKWEESSPIAVKEYIIGDLKHNKWVSEIWVVNGLEVTKFVKGDEVNI